MELFIVLLLIVFNGLFAMAEIALISARKSKLQQEANEGDNRAERALELSSTPNKFLSTVQIGITLFAILEGVFGGYALSAPLTAQLQQIPLLQPYAQFISITIVVSIITYLSLVIGELVPKRLALNNPEGISKIVAGPMKVISDITSPLVWLLSNSTDKVLNFLQIKESVEAPVSADEVRLLIREGTQAGVFESTEKDIVERTLRLGDKKVNTLMTSRKEITWLNLESSFKTMRSIITKKPHSHFPVCRNNLDKVVGVVRTENLLQQFLAEEKIDLKEQMQKPLFIPEIMDGLKVLQLFKKTGTHMALVVDEYGNVQGLVTLTDILEAIVGDIPAASDDEEKEIVKRTSNTFFVDGLVSIDEFKEYFQIKKLPEENTERFQTIGGFVTNRIGRIPRTGDNFILNNVKFEVVDMDGNRVDKILLSTK